ncbi:DUF882 domain-containing protein [Roseibium sp. CAU 1639]|uniref:Murein endopeptidase K n=1 Tax=Roseibium sediminicola TaxID=2933272 RepID=A0ABT0GUK1_9HYPH|nr:DUF882 domain-containing protein [Roseibium sp. CAU 1639]MCK7613114.1 DUF882 domain-containing protein [Roseibium sp. CAU 1639]
MRKRLVDFDAVGRLKRAATAICALAIGCVCLSAAAQAETRTLKLYNTHTKERVSITFKKNGRYIPEGLREANRFLRDWRRNEIIKMDPELFDLVWEVYQKVGARQPIHVVSSYRSPATNNMLRKRSRGVAKNSQHTLGKAMDFYIPGVNLATLRATGLRKQVGGVGYYPRSGSPFVHMDTGRVRHWPKMSRSELAKVFPDGKTLHIPSDGKPLSGYKVALAQSKSGSSRNTSRPTIVSSNSRSTALNTRDQSLTRPGKPIPVAAPAEAKPSGGGNLFASLFGGGNAKDTETRRPGAVGTQPPANVTAEAAPLFESPPPVPGRKIIETDPVAPASEPIAVASAEPVLKPRTEPPALVASAAPPPAANTLDAQRVALESGQPALPNQTLDSRFQVARAPAHKPNTGLSAAAQEAAATLGQSGSIPVPASAPTDDPVAAIAAATGTAVPSPTPAPRPETTLAYASATATPPSLNRSLRPSLSAEQPAPAARPGSAAAAVAQKTRASVSGRIPRDQIVDPLAGFASLPDKSAPALLSGAGTTRHQAFAWLSHPNQRALTNVMAPGNRFVSASFDTTPYSGLRTDRFDGGPAVVVLPVRFAR